MSRTHSRKIVVFLGYDQDAEAWRERYAKGEVLDVTPYGYDRASDDLELVWATSHSESPRQKRLRTTLSGRLGFDLVHAFRNRRLLLSADAVWTHTEREHLAVAAVTRGKVRVIAQSVWLWDRWPSLSAVRRRLYTRLLRRHAIELVLSRVNRDASRESVPDRVVELVPFGSASAGVDAWQPGKTVVAVGNDADRDWGTLALAAAMLPDTPFRVASSSKKARETPWPPNVVCAPTTSRSELTKLLATAACVVVPLGQNKHASGATVCIEAMAAGIPLVVTDVGGIDDYVGNSALLVRAGDAIALHDAIAKAQAGDVVVAKDAHEVRGLTQADYIGRIVAITNAVIDGDSLPVNVSEFVPFMQHQ